MNQFLAEACDGNPVFIPVRTLVLCKLGGSASSSSCATTSGHNHRIIRASDAPRIYYWPTHADHDPGCGSWNDTVSRHVDQPGASAHRTGSAGKSKSANGALPNTGDSQRAK